LATFARNAVVLGLLTAIGPLAIDMYLPALPTVTADFHASVGATQATLVAFCIAFAICQIFYGPLSDMGGRKPSLWFALSLFILASIGCVCSPTIGCLIVFRFLQGAGAAAGSVIPRAVIRDLHTGLDAARLMSLVVLVCSVSPLLAPLMSSVLIAQCGWRGAFIGITVVAALGLLLVMLVLVETRPIDQRVRSGMRQATAGYGLLLRDRSFLVPTFVGAFGMASFFAFLASSSFIYMDHFGLSPIQYSLAFAINALGFVATSQFSAYLAGRFGPAQVVSASVAGYTATAMLLLAATVADAITLPALMGLLFLAYAWLGLVLPLIMVRALEQHGPIAGMASALAGTLQLLTSAVIIVLVILVFDGTPLPMVTTIALCSLAALAVSRLRLPTPDRCTELAE
jgi:MFS transporter, DHA1 family, multidrug resistance protein